METAYIYISASIGETGLWCDVCQLPSAVNVDFAFLGDDGVSVAPGLGKWCPECAPEGD